MLEVVNPAVFGSMIAIGLFAGVLLSLRAGRMLGERAIRRHGSVGSTIGSLEAAVFALLGLLIAFTFSGALQRFDARRVQAVQEANAVGSTYSYIDLLPASAQPKIRDAFRAYVDARIATYRALPDVKGAQAVLALSKELQDEIWGDAMAAVRRKDANPGAVIVIAPALQDMFSLATARVAATQIHPPPIIYAMLIALSLVAGLLAGYQSAGEKGYAWIHKIAFAAIVSLTVYVILDIEYPRLGFIRIDAIDHFLVDVRAGMK